jgi:hypothetical protein
MDLIYTITTPFPGCGLETSDLSIALAFDYYIRSGIPGGFIETVRHVFPDLVSVAQTVVNICQRSAA